MPTCAAFESGLSAAVAVDRQGPAGTGAYEAGECVFGALTVRGASSISNTLFLVRDRRDAERPKDSPRGAGRSPRRRKCSASIFATPSRRRAEEIGCMHVDDLRLRQLAAISRFLEVVAANRRQAAASGRAGSFTRTSKTPQRPRKRAQREAR
jgi:hypothetical protein